MMSSITVMVSQSSHDIDYYLAKATLISSMLVLHFSQNTTLKGQCVSIVLMKPFNLTACFIMECDVNCYDYVLKTAGHGQQCTIMYKL